MAREVRCKPRGRKPRGPHRYKRLRQTQLKKLGPGRHGDGEGLYYRKKPSGKAYWVQRLVIEGRRRDLGLGSADKVTLAEARAIAYEYRRIARGGGNPIADSTTETELTKGPLFRDVCKKVKKNCALHWKTEETNRTWDRLFGRDILPKIGDLPVKDITVQHMEDIFAPHWKGRNSTGAWLQQNTSRVFEYAMAHGHRADNPAAKAKVILGRPRTKETQHQPSLHYRQVPEAFVDWQRLPLRPSIKWLMVFIVLTAARASQAAKAVWSEYDPSEKVWRAPSKHMKAGKAHDVPLSRQAVAILDYMARSKTTSDSPIFTIRRRGGGSDVIDRGMLLRNLHRLKRVDPDGRRIVTHGFRRTFRVWAIEQARAPREVCEAALAHGESDRTVAAYTDGANPFDDRAELMQAWADFVLGPSWVLGD